MSAARDEILGRIRTALRSTPAAPPAVPPGGGLPPAVRPAGADPPIGAVSHSEDGWRGAADPVARFTERVSDYGARVVHTGEASVAACIGALLGDAAAGDVVVAAGLPEGWAPAGAGADDASVTWDRLDNAAAVVTTCAAAIAETGTIVLDGGAGQGRRALTLIPDHHVCVVRAAQITGNVAEILGRLDPTRPLTWVSGPSATSDIELARVQGVHGPRRLDVVVVTDA
ncbi:MAG TPA: LUD domain-containing protein [Acidimicrobiales bacterium]|nr:LUD domain-containing protein [Acidimicrobiales bacterium]